MRGSSDGGNSSRRLGKAGGSRFGLLLVAMYLVISLGMIAAAAVYLSNRQAGARAAAHHELRVVADLKVRQIMHWREERMADARFFSRARFVADDLRRLLDDPQSESIRLEVLEWLSALKGGERYLSVMVFDAQGQPVIGVPRSGVESVVPTKYRDELLARRSVFMTDLERDEETGMLELEVVSPVFEKTGTNANALLAGIVLKIDARQFLFPLLRSGQGDSQTAETVLVRREGEEAMILNDLRHRPGLALRMRIPFSRSNSPSVQVLNGDTRVMEALDYRGVQVLTAGRFVPGTPWALLVKQDREEVYEPLHDQMRRTILVIGVLLLAWTLLVGLMWRQRGNEFLKRELDLERERSQLAERVTHLMRFANDIILLCTLDGRILEANERALVTYGFEAHDISRHRVHELRPAETRPATGDDLARAEREGAVVFESVHRRADGTTFPVEVSSRKVQLGADTLILSIVRDITRRKEQQQEIERMNQHLEVLVRERTAQLTEANANLRTFAHSTAHDLRGPLRSISSFSSIALSEYGPRLDADGRELLQRMVDSTAQLGRLLDDLLEYSKLGAAELTMQPVRLDEAVREAVSLASEEIQKRGALVSFYPPFPSVLAHKASLVLLINNFLSNALKFVDPDVQPRIAIEASCVNGCVRLAVNDNGIGIAPEDIGRIFGMFQRLNPKHAFPGTGLGLAIVKKAAERMGGKVGLTSEPGQGSTFWVTLPESPIESDK